MVKNGKGEWMSLDGMKTEIWYSNNPTLFKDKSYAEAQSMGRKAHVVTLVEEPEKVVVSPEEAKLVKNCLWTNLQDAFLNNINLLFRGRRPEDVTRLKSALINGYTVAKEKKYLVYKKLGGKQKNKQVAQAYRSPLFPDTITWFVEERKNPKTGASAQFTEAEIEHYGLQDCEKEEVTDDDD
ncbi:DUF1642 domain-containing protein [Lacticaseibacillus paracasei]|uniref:DUF1642 domain-containing protein n=1 Tax=Lacticaseibacillus paracasei TaxID=1597 RepID=UPI002F30DD09